MSELRRPDWTEQVGTGIWGLGYRLRANQGLVLLSNGTTLPTENPDRLWPFILTQDQRRNLVIEQAVGKQKNVSQFLEHQSLGKDDLLCVRERHLNDLLFLLEKDFVPDACGE